MRKVIALILIAVCCFSIFVLTSCGTSAPQKSPLIGQWVSVDGESVVFREDGTGIYGGASMTWSTNGNTLVIDSFWYGTKSFDISISGNTLVMDGDILTKR